MAVTILDIAKASGKSFPTVSRALNNHPKISAKTKKEIRALADRMGYRPSFAGKALKKGCTGILSVIVPDLSDPFYAEFIRCFKAHAGDNGYDVVIYDYEVKPELELQYLEMMLTGCCDGVAAFITCFEHTGNVVEHLWNARIPLVAIGTPDSKQIHYDLVNLEFGKALSQILQEQYRRGKRHLAFVQERMSETTLARVKTHILQRLQDMPLEFKPERDLYCSSANVRSQAEDGYLVGCRIFKENPKVDTILAWHGVQAYGIQRAAVEAGKRIPEDVALIACDRTWVTQYAPFPVYSMDQRLEQLAMEACSIIQTRLQNANWDTPLRRIVTVQNE
ncbi:MAG: LacI family transcriptional regulator [Oligosphaeraceae bacterium]|nr:LacI family transcriptional regulator [Oligosphaeraceae bacterium]